MTMSLIDSIKFILLNTISTIFFSKAIYKYMQAIQKPMFFIYVYIYT